MGKKKGDAPGYFGSWGGRFVPETLMGPLEDLGRAYDKLSGKRRFKKRLAALLANYAGRPTPLYFAERLTQRLGGARIFLKREDLLHTGAHKINNAIGQTLLAVEMGKGRIIAETGAGQHGVATATAAALLDCECVVYMGVEDMRRQRLNVERMRLLGAEVVGVDTGSQTLKDAINEALRDWVTNIRTTHYVLGSVLGPDPYPRMVRDFHRVIGTEAKAQLKKQAGRDWPDLAIACVGGGSNAIGLFSAFLDDRRVRLIGVEAGGSGDALGEHAARFNGGSLGVLHGTKTLLLQDDDGQIATTHSVSAGLDYPAVGPEHVALEAAGRTEYTRASDEEAIEAFHQLAETEGILPALESAHALVEAARHAPNLARDKIILVNLSGRGDKDVESVLAWDEARERPPTPVPFVVTRSPAAQEDEYEREQDAEPDPSEPDDAATEDADEPIVREERAEDEPSAEEFPEQDSDENEANDTVGDGSGLDTEDLKDGDAETTEGDGADGGGRDV